MGGPLSVPLSDIFMTKLEKEVIKPPKTQIIYKGFVDDRRKTNQFDLHVIFINIKPISMNTQN